LYTAITYYHKTNCKRFPHFKNHFQLRAPTKIAKITQKSLKSPLIRKRKKKEPKKKEKELIPNLLFNLNIYIPVIFRVFLI